MKIFAHRGYSGKYVENTMEAFEKAIEINVHGIELDVQLTKDKVPVIIHDENLLRLGGIDIMVKDLKWDELKNIHLSGSSNFIPRLEDYILLVKDKAIISNIELKTNEIPYDHIENIVISLIKRYDLSQKIIISSFNLDTIINCKKICNDIKYGYLIFENLDYGIEMVKKHGLDYLHPDYKLIDEESGKKLIENNIYSNIWTLDDPSNLAIYEKYNVKSIITNLPENFRGISP